MKTLSLLFVLAWTAAVGAGQDYAVTGMVVAVDRSAKAFTLSLIHI